MSNTGSDLLAGVCEDHTPVFLIFEKSLGVEALDHAGDAGLRNAQLSGNIHNPRVTLRANEGPDPFKVVLSRL